MLSREGAKETNMARASKNPARIEPEVSGDNGFGSRVHQKFRELAIRATEAKAASDRKV